MEIPLPKCMKVQEQMLKYFEVDLNHKVEFAESA